MKYNKVIFLDVDGVINIPPYDIFNAKCLENVRLIIEKTQCKVVISSSWREGNLEMTKKHFPEWLKEHIVGETVRGYKHTIQGSNLPIIRGNEIKQWVDTQMKYPWHGNPEMKDLYKIPDEVKIENGKEVTYYKGMRSNRLNKHYTYVIIDDA